MTSQNRLGQKIVSALMRKGGSIEGSLPDIREALKLSCHHEKFRMALDQLVEVGKVTRTYVNKFGRVRLQLPD